MASRLELQSKLEELNGNKNVYFQPPESIKMKYRAIRYSLKTIKSTLANNKKYSNRKCYEIIVIGQTPNDEIVDRLLELTYCSYDRQYKADNLYHDVLTLYY